jgi:hypothetical protein
VCLVGYHFLAWLNTLLLDWESEGYDRADMSLPRATNRLVSAILETNERTVVVVISGTPVSMPWASSASTIVQSFYSGGEAGNGLADVLFGKVNPSSKLPLTFPVVCCFPHLKRDIGAYMRMIERRGRSVLFKLPWAEWKGPLRRVIVLITGDQSTDIWLPF